MYRLHYYPDNANIVPHMILCELGVPFELVLVDRARDENRAPAYRALNPAGLLPTLEDDGLVVTETAAICLHLADRHPGAALAPALGTPARATLYRWLFYLANTLHAELRIEFYTHRHTTDARCIPAIKDATKTRLDDCMTLIDEALGSSGSSGPYFLGSRPSVCDYYLAACCRWGAQPAGTPPHDIRMARLPRSFANVARLLDALHARAPVREAFAREGLDPAPYF